MGTDCAFTQVENFMAHGWALAGDGGHLVVTIQMVLTPPVLVPTPDHEIHRRDLISLVATGLGASCDSFQELADS